MVLVCLCHLWTNLTAPCNLEHHINALTPYIHKKKLKPVQAVHSTSTPTDRATEATAEATLI